MDPQKCTTYIYKNHDINRNVFCAFVCPTCIFETHKMLLYVLHISTKIMTSTEIFCAFVFPTYIYKNYDMFP